MKAIDPAALRERLAELYDYDADVGVFRRRVARGGKFAGTVAGYVNSAGVTEMQIDGETYGSHRLIWLLHHREWPPMLTRLDGDLANNRIGNLHPMRGVPYGRRD